MTTTHRTALRRPALAATAALAIGLGLGACTTPLPGLGASAGDATTPEGDRAQQRLEERLQPIVDSGYPAALASVTSPDGSRVDAAVGTADHGTGAPAPVDGEVRVGSNTKPVVAVVVLQLVEEGLVALDEPVETYLPGLLRGDGVDGTAVTVRDLLQHTSGLPEYTAAVAADPFAVQDRWISPRDMLDVALAQPATAAPGEGFAYANTNYLTLGLLVERVTERPLHEQVDERVAQPLGLEHTYLPAPGERELRGEHPLGYHAQEAGDLRDITAMDTSWAWAAGALVSTPGEMNAIMRAVLDGTLLSEESMREMQRTVPAPDDLYPEAAYGLGWQALPLSCGGVAWGHGGDIPGTHTRNAVGPDGTAVTISVTALPFAVVDASDEEALLDSYRLATDALDAALCEA